MHGRHLVSLVIKKEIRIPQFLFKEFRQVRKHQIPGSYAGDHDIRKRTEPEMSFDIFHFRPIISRCEKHLLDQILRIVRQFFPAVGITLFGVPLEKDLPSHPVSQTDIPEQYLFFVRKMCQKDFLDDILCFHPDLLT